MASEILALGQHIIAARADRLAASLSQEQTLAAIDELLALPAELLPRRSRSDLAAARQRLIQTLVNIVVLGEFKRGKSMLINALLGRELLPTGVVPLTAAPTVMRFGRRDRLLVHFVDGSVEGRDIRELANYPTEFGARGDRGLVEHVTVELSSPALAGGLQLVDMPGVDSLFEHSALAARDFLPRIDAALFVLAADEPLSASERTFLLDAAAQVPLVLIVVNKLDHLADEDRSRATEFVRSWAQRAPSGTPLEVFAVSARHGEGVQALAGRLERLRDEAAVLVGVAARALARDAAQRAGELAQLEIDGLELPLTELRKRIDRFERGIRELLWARDEAADLLDQRVRRVVARLVTEPLSTIAAREGDAVRAEFIRYAEGQEGMSPRAFAERLERWIDDRIHRIFAELVANIEGVMADELAELERHHAERVAVLLDEIGHLAEAVFGAPARPRLPQVNLREPSPFSFKLRDPEHGLDTLVPVGRRLAPGALGRRLVLAYAEERLVEMIERHAGRLRSQLAKRVDSVVKAYARELNALVDDSVEGVRSAVQRAKSEHAAGRSHTQRRVAELTQLHARCCELAMLSETAAVDPDQVG